MSKEQCHEENRRRSEWLRKVDETLHPPALNVIYKREKGEKLEQGDFSEIHGEHPGSLPHIKSAIEKHKKEIAIGAAITIAASIAAGAGLIAARKIKKHHTPSQT